MISLFPVAGSTSKTSSAAPASLPSFSELYNALKDGSLAGAALDVFEAEPATGNKLTTLPNFIATPHMGAQTKEAQLLAANVIAEKIIQVLRGVL